MCNLFSMKIFVLMVVFHAMLCKSFVLPTRSRSMIAFQLADGKLAEDKERNKGYGPLGSLTRQGPVPFFIRLSQPDTYEQAVNKYMLLEKCDRMTAQGRIECTEFPNVAILSH